MDPVTNLEEQKLLFARRNQPEYGDADRWADLKDSLAFWKSIGGFLPADLDINALGFNPFK